MIQVACGRAQTVADVANRLAFGKLTKQHRNQMRPTVKTLVISVRLLFFDKAFENIFVYITIVRYKNTSI
jgi:hypothetical protein